MSRRLDSRSLSLFLAVADAASYRQAAEQLHLSQPPLSRAIRELEERLGVRLFDRHASGVSLTDAGRMLRPYAMKVARVLREAEAAMVAQADPGVMRLGLTSAVEPAWFGPFVEALRRDGPPTMTVVSDTSPRLVRLLRAGRLDAACIALPTEAPGLDVLEVDRLPMVVALPAAHPLARRRRVALAALAAGPVFWFERARQPAFYDHCERVFAQLGFQPRRLREAADHHVLMADVAAGRGAALLPRSFTQLRRAGVVYRELVEGDALSVGVGIAAPRDRAAQHARLVAAAQRAMGDSKKIR